MDFVPVWRRSAVARCWPIAAPRGAKGCPPETDPGAGVRRASPSQPRSCPATRYRAVPAAPVASRGGLNSCGCAASGRKAAIGGVVLQALQRGDDGPARLGFTVTRKVGNAVVRNRTRRRLKEAVRLLLRNCPVRGADLVLIGRDSTRKRDFRLLQADIRRALDRNGVI